MDATLPKPEISTPEMLADNSVEATAVLVLNALVAVEVAIPPLLAAAVPTPAALAAPSLSRLSPALLSLSMSELLVVSVVVSVVVTVSVDVTVNVSVPAESGIEMSPAHAGPIKAALTAVAIRDLRIIPP